MKCHQLTLSKSSDETLGGQTFRGAHQTCVKHVISSCLLAKQALPSGHTVQQRLELFKLCITKVVQVVKININIHHTDSATEFHKCIKVSRFVTI